jgi:hypothetical protein
MVGSTTPTTQVDAFPTSSSFLILCGGGPPSPRSGPPSYPDVPAHPVHIVQVGSISPLLLRPGLVRTSDPRLPWVPSSTSGRGPPRCPGPRTALTTSIITHTCAVLTGGCRSSTVLGLWQYVGSHNDVLLPLHCALIRCLYGSKWCFFCLRWWRVEACEFHLRSLKHFEPSSTLSSLPFSSLSWFRP